MFVTLEPTRGVDWATAWSTLWQITLWRFYNYVTVYPINLYPTGPHSIFMIFIENISNIEWLHILVGTLIFNVDPKKRITTIIFIRRSLNMGTEQIIVTRKKCTLKVTDRISICKKKYGIIFRYNFWMEALCFRIRKFYTTSILKSRIFILHPVALGSSLARTGHWAVGLINPRYYRCMRHVF